MSSFDEEARRILQESLHRSAVKAEGDQERGVEQVLDFVVIGLGIVTGGWRGCIFIVAYAVGVLAHDWRETRRAWKRYYEALQAPHAIAADAYPAWKAENTGIGCAAPGASIALTDEPSVPRCMYLFGRGAECLPVNGEFPCPTCPAYAHDGGAK